MDTTCGIRSGFKKDPPYNLTAAAAPADVLAGRIADCSAVPLHRNSDERGHLIELLTMRARPVEPIVHVYQVFAESRSIRAWIYHAKQSDRLCFTDGLFRIALLDLREESSTSGNLATFTAGADSPVLLTIPPLVAHGVMNIGPSRSCYVNLPTQVYDLRDPDKYRLPFDSPLIDFAW